MPQEWEKKLAQDLARLRQDARYAHWAPLAERYARVDPQLLAQWEARYRELLADPARRHRAAACLHGEFPRNEDIDYEDNPHACLTCPHLQAIERALRAAGHRVGIYRYIEYCPPHAIYTDAALDFTRLKQRFGLPAFIEYQVRDPEPHDAGERNVVCTRCNSFISTGSQPSLLDVG